MQKKHLAISLALLAALYGRYKWNASNQVVYDDPEETIIRKKRGPASVKLKKSRPAPKLGMATPEEESKSPSAQAPVDEKNDSFGSQSNDKGQSMAYSGLGSTGGYSSPSESYNPTRPSTTTEDSSNDTSSSSTPFFSGGVGMLPGGGLGETGDEEDKPTLTCSGDVGGGAYSYPISLAISCTSSATVKYCVSSSGACCDPKSAGFLYTSSVVVGNPEGNYCVSFYGETSDGTQSTVVNYNYTIDSTAPNLSNTYVQTFYQTTELPGLTQIDSADFGQTGFGAGVINSKATDPSAKSCEEIATDYASWSGVLVDSFSTETSIPGTNEDVYLPLTKLIYGDNFITSFIVNQNYAADLYSCTTTKVHLEDFPYFEMGMNIPSGQTAVPENAEFVGGFYAYRFADAAVDPAITISRGPASEQLTGGQKLDTNLFSIFY